ncbi:unnamed protein product [Cylicocyclus nassatus]|uniref:Chitin-binding type-2 domain-containing protein n=1 Tax=Cylicocyclus nassatus TaxID=53992 RepID=A0AA36HI12_CYLNA|nr:unnamed protein product [Cylicocyclus nassatus]
MIRLTLLTLLANVALPYPEGRMGTEFCKERRPGLFGQDCSSNVTICNSLGKEIWLMCPFDLVFEDSLVECVDYRISSSCPMKEKQSKEEIETLADLPRAFCEYAPEGLHALTGCSPSVILCTSEIASLMECPEDYVYDGKRYSCVEPSKLESCNPNAAGDTTTSSSLSTASPETEPILSGRGCEGLADGFYEFANCSSYYLTCSGGIARIMKCPGLLIYDRRLGVCNYGRDTECANQVEKTDVCKEDGFYSYGNCTDLFYACSNGRQITMHCPADLAFDQGRRLCDYKYAVDVCKESVGTTVEVPTAAPVEETTRILVEETTTVTPVEEVTRIVIEETNELPSERTTVFPARDFIEQHGRDFFEHHRREPVETATVAVTEEPEKVPMMTTEIPTETTKDHVEFIEDRGKEYIVYYGKPEEAFGVETTTIPMETKVPLKDTAATVIQTKNLEEYIRDHHESMEDSAKQTTEMPVMQPVEHEKFADATEAPVRVLIDKYGREFIESHVSDFSDMQEKQYAAVEVSGKPTTEMPLMAATERQERDYEVWHGLEFSQPRGESIDFSRSVHAQEEKSKAQASQKYEGESVNLHGAGDVTGKLRGKLSGEYAGEIAGEFAGKAEGQYMGEASGNFIGDVSGLSVGEASGRFTGEAQGLFIGEASGRYTGEGEGLFVGESSGDFTGGARGQFMGNAAGQVAGEFTGGALGDFSGHFSGEFSGLAEGEQISRQFSGESISGEYSGDFSGAFKGDFAGEASGKFSGAYVGEAAGEFTGEASGAFSGDTSGLFMGEASGEFSGLAAGAFLGQASGDFSGDFLGDYSGEVSGEYSGEISGDFSGEISGDFSGEMSGELSGEMSGEFSGEASGFSSGGLYEKEASTTIMAEPSTTPMEMSTPIMEESTTRVDEPKIIMYEPKVIVVKPRSSYTSMPSTTPMEPSTTPMEPSTTPMEPSTTPMEPSTTPMEPSTTPMEPSTTPMEPSTTPMEPSTTPMEPSTTPMEPSTTPMEPSAPTEMSGQMNEPRILVIEPRRSMPEQSTTPMLEPAEVPVFEPEPRIFMFEPRKKAIPEPSTTSIPEPTEAPLDAFEPRIIMFEPRRRAMPEPTTEPAELAEAPLAKPRVILVETRERHTSKPTTTFTPELSEIQPRYIAFERKTTSTPLTTTTLMNEQELADEPFDLSTFCKDKPDSFYAHGCSSEMIACVAGAPQSMLCPANLIFDEHKQICEYPENVPCYRGEKEKQEKCQGDEAIARGPCQNTYTKCVKGRPYTLSCYNGQVFSPEHLTCKDVQEVHGCF